MSRKKTVIDVGDMSRRALRQTIAKLREASDERPWVDPARDATPRLSRTRQGTAPSLGDPDDDVPTECVDCGTPFNGYHAVPDENDPTRCEDCADQAGVTARPYDDGVDKVVERALRGLGYSATEAALMNEAAVSRIDLERGLAILTRSGLIKRSRIDQEVRLIREAEGDDEGGGDDDAAVEDALGGGDDAGGDDEPTGDDASAETAPKAETGDSLDAQVDKYLLDYENDAKGASSEPKTESRRRRSLKRLHEADDGDDTITAAGGTAAGASENKDIDVEKFAASVARLIQNPDNLIEFKDTLMKRAANYLKKAYPDDVVEGFNKVMRDQFQLEAGKSEFDMEDEFEAPRAAQAGPGGGGGV